MLLLIQYLGTWNDPFKVLIFSHTYLATLLKWSSSTPGEQKGEDEDGE